MLQHCCTDMERHVNQKCDVHKTPFECPDQTVYYDAKRKRYGMLIHDGGTSFLVIRYCPWCGQLLPGAIFGPGCSGFKAVVN